MIPVRKTMCKTCPFRKDGYDLGSEKMSEIQTYLLKGVAHMCHSEQLADKEPTISCRGGRDYQLTMFHRLGLIDEPTNESLEHKVACARAASNSACAEASKL